MDTRNAERARQVLTLKGANFPNLLDDGKLGEKIYAVPQTYLVDRNGQIVQAVTGSRTLQQFSQLAEQFIKS